MMKIRKAKPEDKKAVLEFCKSTFSWGDYISDVWNNWISEGKLLVAFEKNNPIGICHAYFLPRKKQMWVEGIRIDSRHRRKGYAQRLVSQAESFAQKNNFKKSQMLVEISNAKSLRLAKKLRYKIESLWKFYSLPPKRQTQKPPVRFANNASQILRLIPSPTTTYVKSWRWIPLDRLEIENLIKKKKILISKHDGEVDGLGILVESEHFPKIIQFTLIFGKKKGLVGILHFIQDFARTMKYERIQLLTKENLSLKLDGLEKRYSFYLMEKNL